MSSTKKTKKSKGVTLSFQEFSARVDGDTTTSGNVVYAPSKKAQSQMSSWADEVEEDELITAKERIVLPSAPRASRGPAYDDSQIPRNPPFQANIGNLHYDIEEEDIYKFFRDLNILELKLPRDHNTNRIKGFGFVVFSTRAELIDALVMNEQVLRGRPIRVALLSSDQRVDRGGDFGGSRRPARPPAEDEGVDNWRSVAGETVRETFQQQPSGGDFPPRSRFGDRRRDFDDRRPTHDDGFSRDEWRSDRDRDVRGGNDDFYRRPGPMMDEFPRRQQQPSSMRGGDYRDGARGDFREPRRPPRDDHEDFDEFVRPAVVPRPVVEPRPQSHNNAPAAPADRSRSRESEPKTRKKLVLAPRTVDKVESDAAPRPSSIFGDAKPVDTLKRELEIEEKLKELDVKSGENPGVRRTNSQSSSHGDSSEAPMTKDSDPEDERDFKMMQRQHETRRQQQFPQRRPENRSTTDNRGQYGGNSRGQQRSTVPRGQPPRMQINRGGGNHRNQPRVIDQDGFEVYSAPSTKSRAVAMTTTSSVEDSEVPQEKIISNKFAVLNSEEEDD